MWVKRILFLFISGSLGSSVLCAQETGIVGKIHNSLNQSPLSGVEITVEGSFIFTSTDSLGDFRLVTKEIPLGEQIIQINHSEFESKRFPVIINKNQLLNMGIIDLNPDYSKESVEIAEIFLAEHELEDDQSIASSVSGILSSSKEVFYRAAAFDFGSSFFKPRALDNQYTEVLINEISMNKMSHGRPEWAGFGGLNDVKRNEVFYATLEANPYGFGGVAGTTNSIMKASEYRKGGKVSIAGANQFYKGRIMASYSSGFLPSGWAYAILFSRRFGGQGYMEGTPYFTNSYFGSVERKINNQHSLNLTAFYTPYLRGKSMAVTDEVRSLKGRHYNPYWGDQEGELRNSRMKEVKEPVFMLNHYWTISETAHLNTNLAYQFGTIKNSRIDNGGTRLIVGEDGQKAYVGGAKNPLPDYFHNLPSYHLRHENLGGSDYQRAFLAEKDFLENGQLKWEELYEANYKRKEKGGNSVYVLQNDVEDDRQFTANVIYNTRINKNLNFTSSVEYRNLENRNYAQIKDLLGGSGYLDIDFYADEPKEIDGVLSDMAQSDLNNPDKVVGEKEKYKYRYHLNVERYSAFAQTEYKVKKLEFFAGINLSNTSYQRNGKFRNGYYPLNSYGKGKKLNFMNAGLKTGILYKFSGRHMLNVKTAFLTRPPVLRNSYTNARQNEFPVIGLTSEKIQMAEAGYLYRTPLVRGRITAYYNEIKDATRVGYFFTQGISGLGENRDAAFVQEITNGINTRSIGVEFGWEAKLTPEITVKTAGSIGQSVFTNNPDYYLTSQDFKAELLHGEQLKFAEIHDGVPLQFGDGRTRLKNYHAAGGPERVFQVGVEYRSPTYWFLGASSNFLSHAYVDVSKIRRTATFTSDPDGFSTVFYDEETAKHLLKQERLDSYNLINLVGGKSWRLKSSYLGFFGVVNNLFNTDYKTGGFESSRKADYTNYLEDQTAVYGPQFGTKYFYGFGTTFYLNVYLRF